MTDASKLTIPAAFRDKAEWIAYLESIGVLSPGCPACAGKYENPNQTSPRHTASKSCKSGHRDHCSCDVCF